MFFLLLGGIQFVSITRNSLGISIELYSCYNSFFTTVFVRVITALIISEMGLAGNFR